jgi:hypothetical protein
MRKPDYISYSSQKLFYESAERFYRRYLTEIRSGREPQNHYMAAGSAFDAFVKAELHARFVNDGDPKYTEKALFESQVEEHNRTQAWDAGKDVYKWYCKIGALDDLSKELDGSIGPPRFESEITGQVGHPVLCPTDPVMILGKPDIHWIHRAGPRIIHDFKVQGYYSQKPPSPKNGYYRMFPGRTMHAKCNPVTHKGVGVNAAGPLNMVAEDWAEQLSMYAWVLGEPIGSDYILTIDQILCDSQAKTVRVARHQAICLPHWQEKFFKRLVNCWQAIHNGHIFTDLPYEENLGRIKAIEAELSAPPPDQAFLDLTRLR